MLVLSRQKDETIVIGDGPNRIKITIVDIRGDKVRLGITAPPEVSVHREEIYEAIRREKQAEADATGAPVAPVQSLAPPGGHVGPAGGLSDCHRL